MSTTVSIRTIEDRGFSLAPSQLEVFSMSNKNNRMVRDFLERELRSSDNGIEVGSANYIQKSTHHFIRAKALQSESFLPVWNNETLVPIRPQVFKEYNLKKGDVLISKDSNIGEVIVLDQDYLNRTISNALYNLPVVQEKKFYLLAFLKHWHFRKQLDLITPKGSTIRHAKTLFLDCKIPIPSQENADDIEKYVSLLTESIINKEVEIRRKSQSIFSLIEKELLSNQKGTKFQYDLPRLSDLVNLNRINAGIYSEYFKYNEFLVKNYKNGYSSLRKLDFNVSRGQNLQVSAIGKSIYSDKPKPDFYTVIKPKHLSIYGTPTSREYLGNAKALKTLKAGDIIFGAEGFEKGRSIVVFKDEEKTITNIHGITINHSGRNIETSIFIKCFLDYLRRIGMVDLYAVGGNGGSLAMKYWEVIPFPIFPQKKTENITKLYKTKISYPKEINLSNFLMKDQDWNRKAGIVEINDSIEKIRRHLDGVLNQIIDNKSVKVNFDLDL